jgi:5-methylcytosine-specific restriction protein A
LTRAPLANVKGRLSVLDLRSAKPAPKTADSFYLSAAWRGLLAHLIKVRGRRCEDCGREGVRIFGDHIKELKDGGAPLDENNVRLRCGSCHGKKTVAERAQRQIVR